MFQTLYSQNDLLNINTQRNQINKKGMLVLGSWAIGNFLVSGIGWGRGSGSNMYFHQGNVLWNTVNLSLAGVSLYSSARFNADMGLMQSVVEQNKLEKIFLFNAGLDFGYMAFGLYLRERSKNSINRKDMFEGYGNSLLLQGGFLLAFDLIMFGFHNHNAQNLNFLLEGVRFTGNGLGFRYVF
jgi:hypothetical protein